jgi:HAD superfamily hydrolase (TIGR01509 family)
MNSMSKLLHQRDAWIFDMDGTLTLSIHDFEEIKRELGLPIDQPILEAMALLPTVEAMACSRRLAAIELEIARQAQPQVGAGELLEELRGRGYQVGILTRNSRNNADATLAACGLADFFTPETILSRDCCAPKPSPAGILQLLGQWQRSATRSVMVGDYVFDLTAGRRAGSATVYIDPTGEFAWGEQADVSVMTLAEISRML